MSPPFLQLWLSSLKMEGVWEEKKKGLKSSHYRKENRKGLCSLRSPLQGYRGTNGITVETQAYRRGTRRFPRFPTRLLEEDKQARTRNGGITRTNKEFKKKNLLPPHSYLPECSNSDQ